MRFPRPNNTFQRKAAPHQQSKRCSPWLLILVVFVSAVAIILTLLATHKIELQQVNAKLPSIAEYVKQHNPAVTFTSIHPSELMKNLPQIPSIPQISYHSPYLEQKSKRKRYAYAITITKDGFFQDGAAVLLYSIMKYSWNASYDISFVAFVHPNVTTSRPGLQKLGFHVIEVPIPINSSAIKFDFLREKINKNGCCGSSELIKLTSYRLTQYEKVVHLDADVLMLNPIDELLEKNYSLIYTTDPNMATFKGEEKMPAQGGFLIMKPSIEDYRNIIHTEMTTEFKKYHGWNASKIGWFWGGMTVQGILPYYYQKVSSPKRILQVDRCYYNTMADTDPCQKQQLHELKSAHFTVCQKPWNCYKAFVNRLCGDLHKRWFELRDEAEQFYGIKSKIGSCKGIGMKNYVNMDLEHASFPSAGPFAHLARNVIPDDSPDRIEPMAESMYITDRYD